jgi:hypothetical protein
MVEASMDQNKESKMFAKEYDGQRLSTLDGMGIPIGWVVDGNLPEETWSYIKAKVAPLKPGQNFIGELISKKIYEKTKRRYFGDVVMLLVPDEETLYGFSAGFVLISDLKRNPTELLNESFQAHKDAYEANRNKVKNYLLRLSNMKRIAYLAVTGLQDTK